jgi:MFS family permease
MDKRDPLAALRFRDFRLFSLGGVAGILGQQMQTVAIGWELYERTRSPLALGWVGLVQVIPAILLSLPAGQLADRFDRRKIILLSQVILSVAGLLLALLSYLQGPIWVFYLLLLLVGIARALMIPARAAMVSQLIPLELMSNAATWNTSVFHLGDVVGPALGGLLIAAFGQAMPVYLIAGILGGLRFIMIALITSRPRDPQNLASANLTHLLAGCRFVWQTKVVLAAITLDMFAVLLGGATTLLPIFARDILAVGPTGLGYMRAAPSIGALTMAMSLAYLPPISRTGRTLLLVVVGFGLATIVFGLSNSYYLSLVMLFLLGALDGVSVVIRHTLVQVLTPDEMRGRVSAVNNIFIAVSNELGGFESGLTASLFGVVPSVVGGGIGTVLVVFITAKLWPEIRAVGALDQLHKTHSATKPPNNSPNNKVK